MNHFPIFMNTKNRRILLIGNSEEIIPKARLLTKTSAQLEIYADSPSKALLAFANNAGLQLILRKVTKKDLFDKTKHKIAFVYLSDPLKK